MNETQVLAAIDALRNEMARLAQQLPDQKRMGMGYLYEDIHRLKGRLMQVASDSEWQRVEPPTITLS